LATAVNRDLPDPRIPPRPAAPARNGLPRALLYNRFFSADPIMEAEQLNAIARRLQDLSQRNAELRRYL